MSSQQQQEDREQEFVTLTYQFGQNHIVFSGAEDNLDIICVPIDQNIASSTLLSLGYRTLKHGIQGMKLQKTIAEGDVPDDVGEQHRVVMSMRVPFVSANNGSTEPDILDKGWK